MYSQEQCTRCPCCDKQIGIWHSIYAGFTMCRSCSLIFRFPMPSASAIKAMHTNGYPSENIHDDDNKMESSATALCNHSNFLTHIVSPGYKVLDFGAGTGRFVHMLNSKGCVADGVECSEQARDVAFQKYGYTFSPSIETLSLKVNKYDMITAIEVLEHLPAPSKELRMLHALLKPGGVLYIATPNRDGLVARLTKSRWREAQKPFHLVLFNFVSLYRLLNDCGFIDIKSIRFSPLTADFFPKILLHRVLQLLGLYGGLRVIARKPPYAESTPLI